MYVKKIECLFVGICMSIMSNLTYGESMSNKYFTWDDFVDSYGGNISSAVDIYENMRGGGLKDYSLLKYDFHFLSNQRQNLELLSDVLKKSYQYSLHDIEKRDDNLWELSGETNEFPVTADNLMYWALDLYKRGYEHDSILDGYGAPYDEKNQDFPDFDNSLEDFYFDRGVDNYNAGNLSGAIIDWTNVININPNNPDSYYSRAIVKNELYAWKAALTDYDKAIEIAPDYISAILNRGTLKDENRDYNGAINDYNLVIDNEKSDLRNRQLAFFNRGNTSFNLDKKTQACSDWHTAMELGADYANEQIKKHCEISKKS